MKKVVMLSALAAFALVAAACGVSDDGHSEHMAAGSSEKHMEGVVPGSEADADDATREVIVEASDDLEFDPGSIEVKAGEVITFIVRNTGSAQHEFVLGDRAYQEMHEDMGGDHEMDSMRNAVVVAGGETEEITWSFEESGEVLFGCHEPGHYKGGMFGTITVAG